MNLRDKLAGEIDDPVLTEALKNFKASVDAWSEAAYRQPRTVVEGRVRRGGWRLAAGWALGCALAAGSLGAPHTSIITGRSWPESRRLRRRRKKRQRSAQQPNLSSRRLRTDDADLLATVESDVSRQVPSAMEPLAQLMDDGGNK